jgi:antitoxin component YwqK of YwqJK toxin-antitoxin module
MKAILLTAIAILAIGCKDSDVPANPAPAAEEKPKTTEELLASALDLEDDLEERSGLVYLKGESVPFSGWAKQAVITLRGQSLKNLQADKKISLGRFKDGKIHGKLYSLYPDGSTASEHNYVEGKHHGPYKTYWPNGAVAEEGNYANGVLNGPLKASYDNGQTAAEGELVNGKPHGRVTAYHKNGQKREEGYQAMGNKDGLWTKWDEDGNVVDKTLYKDGEVVHGNSFS